MYRNENTQIFTHRVQYHTNIRKYNRLLKYVLDIMYKINIQHFLNSRAKIKQVFYFYPTLGLIALTLNKIYEKILYSVSFTKPALKFCD